MLRNAEVIVVATARAIPPATPTGVHYIAADITTAVGCATVAQAALDRLGGIDILVNVLGGSNAPAGGFAAPAVLAVIERGAPSLASRPRVTVTACVHG